MKKMLMITLTVMAVLVYFVPAFSQDDIMTLGGADSDYGFQEGKRAPVTFSHMVHMELEMLDGNCAPCHHEDYVDGAFVEGDPIPCADCHEVDPEDETTGLMLAYHKQCQDCHNEVSEGPIACGECHIQKDFYGIKLPLCGSDDEVEEGAEDGAEEAKDDSHS